MIVLSSNPETAPAEKAPSVGLSLTAVRLIVLVKISLLAWFAGLASLSVICHWSVRLLLDAVGLSLLELNTTERRACW